MRAFLLAVALLYTVDSARAVTPFPATYPCIHDKIHALHNAANRGPMEVEAAEVVYKDKNSEQFETQANEDTSDSGKVVKEKISIVADTSNVGANGGDDEGSRVCDTIGANFDIGDPDGSCGATATINCEGTCTAEDILTSAQADAIIDDIIPTVVEKLEDALKVINPLDKLKLKSGSCGSSDYGKVKIPNTYANSGTNGDIVMIVTARPTRGGVVAYGVSCQYESDTKRPVAAHINIAPEYVDTADTSRVTAAVLHEMIHALGFSYSKFEDYLTEFGAKYDSSAEPAEYVVKDTTASGGNTVTKIVTPRVASVTRQHFDCAKADGAELEDGGGAGVRLSHWEKRQFHNEIMTGEMTMVPEPVLSYFTLALFDDMGWYVADYKKAETFHYGYHEGCTFWEDRCGRWDSEYFCETDQELGCTFDRSAKGVCEMREWSTIPSYFQYYESPAMGGSSSLADFCATYISSAGNECKLPANAPSSSSSSPGEDLETYSADSLCFMSTLMDPADDYTGDVVPRCYEMSCSSDDEDAVLTITVGGTDIECPKSGGKVTDGTLQGYVTCPPAHEVCVPLKIVAPPSPKGAASTLAPSLAIAVAALVFVVQAYA